MKYFYDRKSDSLYLSLAERKKYHDSIEAAPGVVLDFDHAGHLIGVDLERASKSVDVSDLEIHEEPAASEAETARLDGSKLRREREKLGLSQLELARNLSVSTNTIARWERGELKIEHPGMLQHALSGLRANRSTNRINSSHTITPRVMDKRPQVGRNSISGHFKETGAHKPSHRVGEPHRTKKK